jgi:hypothetical protein
VVKINREADAQNHGSQNNEPQEDGNFLQNVDSPSAAKLFAQLAGNQRQLPPS